MKYSCASLIVAGIDWVSLILKKLKKKEWKTVIHLSQLGARHFNFKEMIDISLHAVVSKWKSIIMVYGKDEPMIYKELASEICTLKIVMGAFVSRCDGPPQSLF